MTAAPHHSDPVFPRARLARPGWRLVVPLAIVVAGLLAATVATGVLLRVSFQIPARQHQAIVSGHLLRALGQVETMAAFRQSNAAMTGAEFDRFAARLFDEKSGLVALSWAQRVADRDRAAFEQEAGGDGLPGYQITDMAADGLVRAESRPEYFPVRFGAPLAIAGPALGFDISMHPVRRAALVAARDSGKPCVTERIVLVNDIEGVIVLAPVYDGGVAPETIEERRRRFQGVIIGAMQIPDLLAGALTGDEFLVGLDTLLVDLNAQGPTRLLAALPSPRRNSSSGAMPREDSPGWNSASVDLAVGDRTWRMIVTPAPISAANPFRTGPYVVGFAVLLVSLSLAWVLWMRLNRMHEIEVRVRDRTRTLQQSEQRARLITDTIPVLIAYVDARLRYRYVNGTMDRWYALPGNRIVGEKVESVVGPERFARVREHIDAVLAGREVSFAQAARYPDGAFREVEANYLPDFDDRGNVQGYFTTVVDVTNWRRLEREIESFFSLNLGLMAIVSFDGAFSRVNPAWETSLGYTVDEFVGRSIQTLVHPEDEERFAAEFALLQAGEDKSHGFEVRFLHRNGDVRLLSWIAAAIVEQRIVLVTATDVTDQRRSEGELRAAQQRAAAAVQAKGMFLTNISHEIRTPLTSVIGFSEIVLQSDLTPKLRDQVRKIRTSGQVLLDLVDDILDMSKIDAGRLTLEEVPFHLSGMVEDAASLLGVRAAHKYIDLAFSIDPGVPDEVRGDPVRLSQVLVNLIGNALKFTDEGEVRVRVRLGERGKGSATLLFEVRDTGIGLGEGESERLFDPFVQGDASTTRRFGGTGLGLAISRDIIRLMGGKIGAKQRESRGSLFWFSVTLPVLGSKTVAQAGSLRVLVTGEDSARRDWAFAVLSGACREVALARTDDEAAQAVAAAAEKGAPFDAVVVQLAATGGPGAAYLHRILRATEAPPRAIALAPPGGGSVGEEWMALGVDQFVPDPPTSARLIQAVSSRGAALETSRPAPGRDVLAGLRVLLAEDNELTQDVAAEMIRAAGGEIAIVANGAEALQKVAENPSAIDVVLMDLQMPGVDGIVAARRLRERYPAADLPIIAFTAHALAEERDRAMAAGMNDFLVKPVTRDRMIQALVRYAPGAPEAAVSAAPPDADAAVPAAPFDLSRAAAELGIPESVARGLAVKFRTQYADARERLRAGFDGGDYAAVAALAHRVRGSAGYLQAQTLVGCATALEEDVKSGATASQLHDRVVAFDRALAAVLAAAASLRAESGDTPPRT